MKLHKPTFDSIAELAANIGPRCDQITYVGAGNRLDRHGKYVPCVTFACREPHDRCGFYLDVDESSNVVNNRPISYVTGTHDTTFSVTLLPTERLVKRVTPCQRCGKFTPLGEPYCSPCRVAIAFDALHSDGDTP